MTRLRVCSRLLFPLAHDPVDFGMGDWRRRRWRGRRRDAGKVIVEVEIEPELAAGQSALQRAGGGEQVFFEARNLAVAEGALAMKEFFHGGIITPLRREGLEASKGVRMQMADLGEIAFLLEDIGVQQTGIRVFDR